MKIEKYYQAHEREALLEEIIGAWRPPCPDDDPANVELMTTLEFARLAQETFTMDLNELSLELHSAGFPLRFDGEAYRWAMVRA